MANIGLTRLYVWKWGTNGKVAMTDEGLSADGVWVLDTTRENGNLGAKTANITGLSGTPTKITGNNEVVDVTNPPSAPSVAIDANAMNFVVKQKILGRQELSAKGVYADSTTIPDCGLAIESYSPTTGKPVFYVFPRGKFTEASQNVQTNTDTAETREDDNLTFTALGYDGLGGQAYATADASQAGFSKQALFDLVAPGQTLVTASSDKTPGNVGVDGPKVSVPSVGDH